MRGRMLVLVLMATLVVASFPPAGRAAESAVLSWYVTKISVTVPMDFTAVESYEIVRDRDGPMVLGFGLGGQTGWTDFLTGRADLSYVGFSGLDDDEWSVGTSKDAGAINAHLLPRTGLLDWSVQGTSTTYRGRLEPGAPLVRLLFVTNGHFTKQPIEVAPAPGLQVETRSGTGADVMTLTDTRNSGIAASVGPTGGGTVDREGIAREGVVGVFATACNCRGEWRSPDARSGRWASGRTYTELPLFIGGASDGTPMFSGPAGQWSLSWTGVAAEHPAAIALFGAFQPIVAVWAPIGVDWQYFNNPATPVLVH